MAEHGDDGFYASIAVFDGFQSLMDPALYTPLPGDWWIGIADIVDSTAAIAAGRYKVVNMAGAAVIASVANGLGGREFPFVFGGDGASFAVAPGDLAAARDALAATARWVSDDLILTMRAAMLPVSALRAHGLDVRVTRFAPSANVSYAMFSGGGLGWAEAAMKRGEFAVTPAPEDARPDLAGLSCRFEQMPSRRGVILSVIVTQIEGGSDRDFRALIEDVTALVERSPEAGRPVPASGPPLRWPPQGNDLEARASRDGPLALRRVKVFFHTLFAFIVMRFKLNVGGFVAEKYITEVVQNSDFRKYDDGLRMVLDCTPDLEKALRKRLGAAAEAGVAQFGLHRQAAAMMTCFTPSALRNDHVHFIDGADGGYASAATALKAAALSAATA